jgi:hypothetical protein
MGAKTVSTTLVLGHGHAPNGFGTLIKVWLRPKGGEKSVRVRSEAEVASSNAATYNLDDSNE